MSVIHIWADTSKRLSGVPHVKCSKSIEPMFAIPAGATPEEIANIVRGMQGRVCRKCAGEKTYRSAR